MLASRPLVQWPRRLSQPRNRGYTHPLVVDAVATVVVLLLVSPVAHGELLQNHGFEDGPGVAGVIQDGSAFAAWSSTGTIRSSRHAASPHTGRYTASVQVVEASPGGLVQELHSQELTSAVFSCWMFVDADAPLPSLIVSSESESKSVQVKARAPTWQFVTNAEWASAFTIHSAQIVAVGVGASATSMLIDSCWLNAGTVNESPYSPNGTALGGGAVLGWNFQQRHPWNDSVVMDMTGNNVPSAIVGPSAQWFGGNECRCGRHCLHIGANTSVAAASILEPAEFTVSVWIKLDALENAPLFVVASHYEVNLRTQDGLATVVVRVDGEDVVASQPLPQCAVAVGVWTSVVLQHSAAQVRLSVGPKVSECRVARDIPQRSLGPVTLVVGAGPLPSYLGNVGVFQSDLDDDEMDFLLHTCDAVPLALKAAWTLDGVGDGTEHLFESVSRQFGATTQGPVVLAAGNDCACGGCVRVNGSARAFVHLPPHPTLDLGKEDFTWMFWMKPIAPGPLLSNHNLTHTDGTASGDISLVYTGSTLQLFVGAANTEFCDGYIKDWGDAMRFWTHIIIRRQSSRVYMYMNSTWCKESMQVPTDLAAPSGMHFGLASQLGQAFAGYIDDIRLFHRAVNLDEIAESLLACVGSRGADDTQAAPSNASCIWDFDHVINDDHVLDTSGGNNTASVTQRNGNGWVTFVNSSDICRCGACGHFDGGYLHAPTGPLGSNIGDATWSMWLRPGVPKSKMYHMTFMSARNNKRNAVTYGIEFFKGLGQIEVHTVAIVLLYCTAIQRMDQHKWTHVVVRRFGGWIEIFVDGASCGTPRDYGVPFDDAAPFVIGYEVYYGAGQGPFLGHMDEIQTFRRALSLGEILNLFTACSKRLAPPMVDTPTLQSTVSLTASATHSVAVPDAASATMSATLVPSDTMVVKRTATATRPPPFHSVTSTQVVPPSTLQPVVPTTVKAVTEATGGAALAVAAVGGPATAVVANRGAASLQSLYCSVTDLDDLDDTEASEHPLRVEFGTGPLRQQRALMVLNVALAAALALLAVGCGVVGLRLGTRFLSFLSASAVYILIQPVCRAVTLVLRFDDEAVWVALAVACIAAMIGACAGVGMVLRRSAPQYTSINDDRGAVQVYCLPGGMWLIPDDDGLLRDDDTYAKTVGRAHEAFRRRTAWIWYELAFSASIGILSGIRPQTTAGCSALGAVLVVLFAVYAAVCAWRRYFSVPLANVTGCLASLLLTGAAAASLHAQRSGLSANTATAVAWCVVTAEAVALLGMLVEMGAWAMDRLHHGHVGSSPTTSSSDYYESTETPADLQNPLLNLDNLSIDAETVND